MEDKNVTKISLSTFFLILAIIAIIVMGIFIYKLNNDKTIESNKVSELSSRIANLEELNNNTVSSSDVNTTISTSSIKTDIDKNKVELFLNFLMLINNKKKVFYVVVFIPMFNHTIIDGPDYIYMIQNIYA